MVSAVGLSRRNSELLLQVGLDNTLDEWRWSFPVGRELEEKN